MDGESLKTMNATFLALVPKSLKDKTFFYYKQPISLCNLVYKIISKVISSRIKQKLVENMSLNEFGFLVDIQIHDVIDIAQSPPLLKH